MPHKTIMKDHIHQKKIFVDIKQVIFNESHEISSMAFSFNDSITPFENTLSINIDNLHDILFGCIKILFFTKTGKKESIFAGSKIYLKCFFESEYQSTASTVILNKKEIDKSDYYNPDLKLIGTLKWNFREEKFDEYLETKIQSTFVDRIFAAYFSESNEAILAKVYRLLCGARDGTLLCHFWAVVGMLPADYYYSTIHGRCSSTDCKGVECKNEFCKNGYNLIPSGKINEGHEWMQMAAASYGDSFPAWNLKPLKKKPEIKDKRLRSILERIEIDEADFDMDFSGKENVPAFISFFKKSQGSSVVDTLVISFKGTTNGLDALYDLECSYVEFQDGYTHSGVKKLADGFLNKFWDIFDLKMQSRKITIVHLTGHSLGGAVSILVHLRLKELNVKYFLKTVSFSSPPVVSENIARKSNPNIDMWSYGTDMITRLSYGSVLDLKYFCISVSTLYQLIANKNAAIEKIQAIRNHIKTENSRPKLFHPGKLWHIRKYEGKDKSKFGYKVVNYSFFSEILWSKFSTLDHFLHNFSNAFSETSHILKS